ncbi:MAG: O-antigen ligase family protein [Verrucomicrobiota bacterium]
MKFRSLAPAPDDNPRTPPAQARLKFWAVVLFLAAHAILGPLMKLSSTVGTVHALATVFVGIFLALTTRQIATVACVGAYIVGSEVFWRISKAQVFWEIGKYSTSMIFLVAIVRFAKTKHIAIPVAFFLLLIPSAVPSFIGLDLSEAKERISFNLSGPFSLAVCACFFIDLRFTREQHLRLLITMIGPLIGLSSLVLYSTATASTLEFTGNARGVNLTTSGGFGPNQVSAMLGLGTVLAFLIALNQTTTLKLKCLMFCAMLLFATQSALTFSRTGIYLAGGAILLAAFYLWRDPRMRFTLGIMLAASILAATLFVVPFLNHFTGGVLSERFKDTDPTGRDLILKADLYTFLQHPVFGVGVGMAATYRQLFFSRAIEAHTEFSRLLAEHGVFGLFALVLMFSMAWTAMRQVRSPGAKAIVATTLGWSFLFMATSGMRLLAPSFLFGLAFARIHPNLALKPSPLKNMKKLRRKHLRRTPNLKSPTPIVSTPISYP